MQLAELFRRHSADRVLIGVTHRQGRAAVLQLAGPEADQPRMMQLAHIIWRHAQRDGKNYF